MTLGQVGDAHAVSLGDDAGDGFLPEIVVNLRGHHLLKVNGLRIDAEGSDVIGIGGSTEGEGNVRLLVVVVHDLTLGADAKKIPVFLYVLVRDGVHSADVCSVKFGGLFHEIICEEACAGVALDVCGGLVGEGRHNNLCRCAAL